MKFNKNLLKFEGTGTKVYIPTKRYSIDLSLTENPLKFSSKVLEIIDKEKVNINHYPDPYHTDLKKALSKKFGIHEKNFIFGTGADGLIENIVRILINPGEKVVMPDLSFLNASFATIIAGGEVAFSKMKDDFHIDFVDLKSKIDEQTKMVFICNPNNPTGLIESKEDILDLVKFTDALVVVDEANIEFGGESLISKINKVPNLIIMRTFSKALGLAGLRLGFIVTSANLAEKIQPFQFPFPFTSFAEEVAIASLNDKKFLEKSLNFINQERKFLQANLEKKGFKIFPSVTNTLLVKGRINNIAEKLLQLDVSVVDGSHFNGLNDRSFRIAVRDKNTNRAFLKQIDKILKEVRKMERQERVKIAPNARKLISRAFVLGIDAEVLRTEIAEGVNLARESGKERITKRDLENLTKEVRSRMNITISS